MAGVTKTGPLTVILYGHASVMIRSRFVMYVDPYVLPDKPVPASIVFITHAHSDHCARVDEVVKPGSVVIAPSSCEAKLKHIPDINLRIISEGDILEVKGVKIEVVPAYNFMKPYHPRGEGVGYVIETQGQRIYIAGDTDKIPEMDDLKDIDLAFLPIGGTYTMDIDEAAHAVSSFKPKKVIPYHYNYISGTEADPRLFMARVKEFSPETNVVIL